MAPNNPAFWQKSDHTSTHPQLSDYTHATPEDTRDLEIVTAGKGLILHSANAKKWRITVDNSGTLVVTEVTP